MLVAIANKIEQEKLRNENSVAGLTVGNSSHTRLLETSSARPLESDSSQNCLANNSGVAIKNLDSMNRLKRIDPQAAATISSFNFFMAPQLKPKQQ